MRSLVIGAVLCALAPMPAAAASVVYTGQLISGPNTANYAIVTDGTIGLLAASNITRFSATVFDGTSSFSFSSPGGAALTLSDAALLSATDTDLFYEFSGTGALFSLSQVGAGEVWFGTGSPRGVAGVSVGSGPRYDNRSVSNQIIASVAVASAVPEPATWGMMMLGFGIAGAALRRRQRVTTRVKFA